MVAFRLRTGSDELALLGLPWDRPLDTWPEELSLRIPAGDHRHVVRFLERDGLTLALKELPRRLAEREYTMLEHLREDGLPGVTLVGIATDRADSDEVPLEAVLITRHLRYSLPYRFLFSENRHAGMRDRVVDALAILLVRLHLHGFFWGDCSLNNALFRRDAGALSAYVVDTETAEYHQRLSDGQRELDLGIAIENVAGGLLDLEAAGLLDEATDPERIVSRLSERYEILWNELHAEETIPPTELGRIHARLARLNDLGFDTEEYELSADGIGARFRPTVVEEGHHSRTLARLTAITALENQARRLLADMRGYGAWLSQTEEQPLPEAIVAYRWLTDRWGPALGRVPETLRVRLEDAEIYHEILEHNWYMSEREGGEVLLQEAVEDYVASVLSGRADERTVIPATD